MFGCFFFVYDLVYGLVIYFEFFDNLFVRDILDVI